MSSHSHAFRTIVRDYSLPAVDTALGAVNHAILSTPSGDARNLITEAHLKLLEASRILNKELKK